MPLVAPRAVRVPNPTTVEACDRLLRKAVAARALARAQLAVRDDLANRAECDAADLIIDFLLGRRSDLART